ncbi:MAG TPA: hypothetical protein VFN36_05095 [Solirubrobacteraceae bacterium]|nr:hypothetical protein [Solirubrobacteraceae bacterium]
MTRRRARPLTVAGLILCALILPAAGGAAAAGSARLTAFEYRQLSSARARVKSAKSLRAAIFDCQLIQMQSPLLARERADCIAQIQLGGFGAQMQVYVRRCTADRAVATRLRCLLPAYLRFARTDAAFDTAEAAIHRLAVARGLGEPCANLLSDPPAVLARERVAQRDIETIVRAIRAGNLLDFEAASGRTMAALVSVAKGQQTNRGPLTICPHE